MRSAENLSAKRLNIISRAVADALMGVKWIRYGIQGRGKFPFAKYRREISTKKNPTDTKRDLERVQAGGVFYTTI
jgi:hypothetical protein